MTRWAISDIATGELLATIVSDVHPSDEGSGFAWDGDIHAATTIADDIDPACLRWDAGSLAFVDDLDALRARRWAEAKALRDAAEWTGCSTPLGIVDSDPDSQRKVSGAVQMAMIAQAASAPFSVNWTMQDNSVVEHDGPAMIAMGVAVGQHVAACHDVGVAKRGAIEAADEASAIAEIDIETGWP